MTIRFVAPFNIRDYQEKSYLNIKCQLIIENIGPYIKHDKTENQALDGLKYSGLIILCLGIGCYIFLFSKLLNNATSISNF